MSISLSNEKSKIIEECQFWLISKNIGVSEQIITKMLFFIEALPMYSVEITSVDHAAGSNYLGKYFNFNRQAVPGLSVGGRLEFKAFNPRTGYYGEVVVWGTSNGGSTGDAHGRFNGDPIGAFPGQWQTGDRLVPVTSV